MDLTRGDAAIRHALAAMETASVVWIPESEHELPYLVDIDDDIPDLVDIDDIHECSKVWYAVLVGKAPGVFDTLAQPEVTGEQIIYCNTQAGARRCFDVAIDAGMVKCIHDATAPTAVTRMEFPAGTYN